MNTINDEDILLKRMCEKIINPLRLIFWGGLFIIIDFNLTCHSTGGAVGIDLLNDTIGLILVTIGLLYLVFIEHNQKYDIVITIVAFISIFFCAGSILSTFYPSIIEKINKFILLIWFIEKVGLLLFCWSLKLLFDDDKMRFLYDRWSTLTILFIFFSILPSGTLLLLQNQLNLIKISMFLSVLFLTLLQIVPLIYLLSTIKKIIKFARSKIPDPVM